MNKLSDEQLIEILLEGQTAALDELYTRYSKKLFVFCHHTLGAEDTQEAEDMVQEVFIRVIKAARTFDPQKAAFSTWLYRIARNRCIDTKRKRARFAFLRLDRQPLTDGFDNHQPLEEVLPALDEDIEAQMMESALHQAIRDCIQGLENEEEKQAILLYYLSGKVYREIAEILGKSLSTAKNRVHTAQVKVKGCLEHKGFQSL